MSLVYRLVKGSPLTDAEGDGNVSTLDARIAVLEAAIPTLAARGIANISLAGEVLTFLYSDTTSQNITLPVAKENWRGTWTAATNYFKNDTFGYNSAVYIVLVDHHSAPVFDPAATDGLGHDLYGKEFDIPAGIIPTGGSAGNPLVKLDGTDYNVLWATWAMPGGGTIHQALMKNSSTSGDWSWQNISAGVSITLEQLTDTSIIGQSDGDLLRWSGGSFKWENIQFNGLYSIEVLSDVTLAGTTTGQVLRYNGSAFVNANLQFADMFAGKASAAQVRQSLVTSLATTGGVTLDASLGDLFTVGPTGDILFDTTTSASGGALITLLITTVNTTSRTLTFNTNFVTTGTLVTGTVSGKRFVIQFRCISGILYETSRTVAM